MSVLQANAMNRRHYTSSLRGKAPFIRQPPDNRQVGAA